MSSRFKVLLWIGFSDLGGHAVKLRMDISSDSSSDKSSSVDSQSEQSRSDSSAIRNESKRMGDYTVGKEIGRGKYGKVCEVTNRDSQKFAMKEWMNQDRDTDKKRILLETLIFSRLNEHDNIIKFEADVRHEGRLFLVMEYAGGGNLSQRIAAHGENSKSFSNDNIMKWSKQIAAGLKYIHEKGYIHRDLKPANIMISENDVLKITDFGLSKQVDTAGLANTNCGTPLYMAPELYGQRDQTYSSAVDIWALGCIIYELCELKPAFDNVGTICGGDIPEIASDRIYEDASTKIVFRELCSKMLDRDPEKRPTAESLCERLNCTSAEDVTDTNISSDRNVEELRLSVGKRQKSLALSRNVSKMSLPLVSSMRCLVLPVLLLVIIWWNSFSIFSLGASGVSVYGADADLDEGVVVDFEERQNTNDTFSLQSAVIESLQPEHLEAQENSSAVFDDTFRMKLGIAMSMFHGDKNRLRTLLQEYDVDVNQVTVPFVECAEGTRVPCSAFASEDDFLLIFASIRGHDAIVSMLIDDFHAVVNIKSKQELHGMDRTPLHFAASGGHTNVVEFLLGAKAHVHVPDVTGRTAIHEAAQRCHVDIFYALISVLKEQHPNTYRNLLHHFNPLVGSTPMEIAESVVCSDIVELLSSDEWRPLSRTNPTLRAFHEDLAEFKSAIFRCDKKTIQEKLERGIGDVNEIQIDPADMSSNTNIAGYLRDSYDINLLHVVAGRCEDVAITELLLKFGAKVDSIDSYGPTVLHDASFGGHTDVVRLHIDRGVPIDAVDSQGFTALWLASHQGHDDVVQLLIQKGAAVNVQDSKTFNRNPLHTASSEGHVAVVQTLIKSGAKIDASNSYGHTALYTASYHDQLDVIEFLIDSGASTKTVATDIANTLLQASCPGATALLQASFQGRCGFVKVLLADGANVNMQDESESTSLHFASYNGHLDVVQLLLNSGAKIDVPDEHGRTVLHIASYNGHLDVVQLLLNSGAKIDVPDKDGETVLHSASYNGHLDVVQLLLNSGAKIDVPDKDGETVLHSASYNGHLDVVQLLLNSGAKIDVPDEHGRTVLHSASYNGHLDVVVQLLVNSGAKIDVPGKDGETVLHVASYNGHLDLVQLLLNFGAKIDARDNDFHTALQAASLQGHLDVVQLLLLSNAEVDAEDNSGSTSLYWASKKGHVEIIRLLLQSGANIDAIGQDGFSPLFVAAAHGHADAVSLLVNAGGSLEFPNEGVGVTALHAAVYGAAQEVSDDVIGVVNVLFPAFKKKYPNDYIGMINQRDDFGHGNTALVYAVRFGLSEVAEILASTV